MEDIFDRRDGEELLARIARVKADARPLWGKMSVGQAFAHCQVALEVALGERKLRRGLIGVLFGGMAKKQLMAKGPFKKNMPTAPEFRVQEQRDVERERARLVELTTKLVHGGPAVLTKEPHPFFGAMTPHEWSTLQWKHLDHHLRQFGA